jgi:predicted YcjX-like family ATPase
MSNYPMVTLGIGQTMTANTSALSVHIHHLLDEHVAAHLATNYTDYTQLRVYQVGLATIRPKKVEYHLAYSCSLVACSPSLQTTPIHSCLLRTR